MALISLTDVSLRLGGPPLLDNIRLQIERGERVSLLGRNGAGKSTLLKIMKGSVQHDTGTIDREKGIKISYFSQEIPGSNPGSVFDTVAEGLGKQGELLSRYFRGGDDDHEKLHGEMETHQAWTALDEVRKICSLFHLEPEAPYDTLSGGRKRRALLASALVSRPDLLLLDEPTNHLDIETILWMEELLLKSPASLVFVTHDRAFMKRLATRIIELDRGRLFDWACPYDIFLERKQAYLDAEEKKWEKFDKKLEEEETWLRRGVKARRTRNEGRVKALMKMREERAERIDRLGTAGFRVEEGNRSGRMVMEIKKLTFFYDTRPVISDFSLTVSRGDKIGIIGPNGCGKTTLVNLLTGGLSPVSGTVRTGTGVEILYYDQMREQLAPDQSVWKNVLPNGDKVTVNGRTRHITAYLEDFLFSPDRLDTPVAHLSGGEKNRLLLARLFTRSGNLLILDEPTNDLDMETLELLESLLVEFEGTVILISHDRAFLNDVATSCLVFEGDGVISEYAGGYDDWLSVKERKTAETQSGRSGERSGRDSYLEQKKSRKEQERKLSFKEKRELEDLPGVIESLEICKESLLEKLSDPEVYKDGEAVQTVSAELEKTENDLKKAYLRWEELEALSG